MDNVDPYHAASWLVEVGRPMNAAISKMKLGEKTKITEHSCVNPAGTRITTVFIATLMNSDTVSPEPALFHACR